MALRFGIKNWFVGLLFRHYQFNSAQQMATLKVVYLGIFAARQSLKSHMLPSGFILINAPFVGLDLELLNLQKRPEFNINHFLTGWVLLIGRKWLIIGDGESVFTMGIFRDITNKHKRFSKPRSYFVLVFKIHWQRRSLR